MVEPNRSKVRSINLNSKHMKNFNIKSILFLFASLLLSCADNSFEEYPLDNDFPLQLVLDAEEGAALPDAEDINVEFQIADYVPGKKLPNTTVSLDFAVIDVEGDMIASVEIDKIIYEVEEDNCIFERELSFDTTDDGLRGTISIEPDPDLKSIPESFEIIFSLPGSKNTEGAFKVEFSNLQSSENIFLGNPSIFQYEVLDTDVAGEWELEFSSSEEFESFKEVFGLVNPDLSSMEFGDITGKIKAEFEFEEMKFVIELAETEEVTTCEDGETEVELVNKEIEIECDYNAEDGELELEGSHPIINSAGLVETELDFIVKGEYSNDSDEAITFHFFSVVDEDNFSDGEELFKKDEGVSFTFERD